MPPTRRPSCRYATDIRPSSLIKASGLWAPRFSDFFLHPFTRKFNILKTFPRPPRLRYVARGGTSACGVALECTSLLGVTRTFRSNGLLALPLILPFLVLPFSFHLSYPSIIFPTLSVRLRNYRTFSCHCISSSFSIFFLLQKLLLYHLSKQDWELNHLN